MAPDSYNRRMQKKYDVCVRGAGIVGRTLALLLAGQRLRVALVQAPTAASAGVHHDVRAYALNARSRSLLESVRCWPDPQTATAVLAMQVHGDAEGAVQFAAQEQGSEALNWIVDVPALEELLANAVRFQSLIDVVDDAPPAALTVVCEGRASQTRAELGVEFDRTPYHQSALAARVDCAQGHAQIARQWFSQGEILALLPLDGAQGKRCALVWSVSPQRALALQQCPASEFAAQLAQASHDSLGTVQLCGERVTWPLQHASARHWCGIQNGMHWVLAGDAAHNVHPLAGQGLNLGLGDVGALAAVLDARPYWRELGDLRLLRAYERARKAELAVVGGSGDALQRLFDQPAALLQNIRNWGMLQFDRSGPFKHWVTGRAMGTQTPPVSPKTPTRN